MRKVIWCLLISAGAIPIIYFLVWSSGWEGAGIILGLSLGISYLVFNCREGL